MLGTSVVKFKHFLICLLLFKRSAFNVCQTVKKIFNIMRSNSIHTLPHTYTQEYAYTHSHTRTQINTHTYTNAQLYTLM